MPDAWRANDPADADAVQRGAHTAGAGPDPVIIRAEAALARLPDGHPAALALRDVLDSLRQLREADESARQRYLGLLNALPDAVTVLDLEGNILEANDAACAIYGYGREQLTSMRVFALNPGLEADRMLEVQRTYRVGDVFSVETSNRRGDGTWFPVEVHSAVFLDRGEMRVVAVARDVSARRAAEDELRASEARYRLLLQAMDKGIIVQDQRGRVISVNAAACRILGASESQVLDPRNRFQYWRVVDEYGNPIGFSQMPGMRALRERRTVPSTLLGIFSPERSRYAWLAVTSVPQFRREDEAPFQVISTFGDVTEFKRDSELFAQTQALARIGGWDWNPLSGAMYWTDELYRILDRAPGEEVDLDQFIGHVEPGERAAVRARFAEARERAGSFDLECRVLTARGNQRWVRLLGRSDARDGEAVRASGTLQDVTADRLHEEELKRQALTDPLTGLANRDAALEQLAQSIARGTAPLVLYLDLDRFKVINDLLGHAAGDALIAAAGARLRDALSGRAMVSRFGGDEFLILVPDPSIHRIEAPELAARALAALARPFDYAGEEFSITGSIGVARHPQDGVSAQQLIQSADAAVNDAKRRGRNTWQSFNPQLARQISDRLLIETQLRRALENHEFRLVYQPQVSLADGRVQAAEALIRWHSRMLGEMRPDRFIGHAETTGDIVRIGAWVLREACRQMRAWRDAGCELERVAVNVSFRQFLSEDLAEIVFAALDEHQLPGEALELEITERVLIEDAPDTFGTFEALKKRGVQISIDDFGEGYSALGYLRRLPIDGLKISHAFLKGVPANRSDIAICRAIAGIADSLGLKLVAEGVETEAQRRFLLDQGITLGQGFLFSEPRAPEELEAILRRV